MKHVVTDRGFGIIKHPPYADAQESETRLVQESSAISGEYPDAFDHPGSSYLWIGADHHLNREEVALLVKHLKTWLNTGKLV